MVLPSLLGVYSACIAYTSVAWRLKAPFTGDEQF